MIFLCSIDCAKKLCLFHLAASSAFVLSTRATATRVAPTFTANLGSGNESSYQHSCFLWRRKAGSETLKMAILESPSAERNKGPIYDQVLAPTVFPRLMDGAIIDGKKEIRVLELAAGCGVHTTHFVSSYLSAHKGLGISWHPSDPDPEARSSIDARVERENLANAIVPANAWILGKTGGTSCGDPNRDRGDAGGTKSGNKGDITEYSQHTNFFDLVLCVNMIHIAPWEATLGLMECAGKVLKKGGLLVCYGPYKVGGTAVESNLRFDEALRSRNSQWGVRNLEDVIDAAKKEGLEFVQGTEMPANNMSVLFCRS